MTVDTYTGTVPNRSQTQSNFNTNVQNLLNYIASAGFIPALNTDVTAVNTNTTLSEGYKDTCEAARDIVTAAVNATEYDNSATYNFPDIVITTNGQAHRCIGSSVVGDNPVGSVTGNWLLLTPYKYAGSLTKSFTVGEQYTIPLSRTVELPMLTVGKEKVQTGVSTDRWVVDANLYNFGVHDTALNADLTYSSFQANVTLSTGSFAASDNGKKIHLNGGVLTLINYATGKVLEDTAPTSYGTVTSGNWQMYGASANSKGLSLNSLNLLDDVSDSTYTTNNLDYSAQTTSSIGFYISPDGTKLYTVAGTVVYQYTISTPWDLSTAAYATSSFDSTAQTNNAKGIFFSDDGTKMYLGDSTNTTNEEVYQYTLTTAWDLSTASYDSIKITLADNSIVSGPYGIGFTQNGTVLWLTDGNYLYDYTLTTPWDLSTASYNSKSPLFTNGTPLQTVQFLSGGTKLYSTENNDRVYQYSLTTPYDITTIVDDSVSELVSSGITITAIFVGDDENKLYINNYSGNVIYENDLSYSEYAVQNEYVVAITDEGGQIDSTYWTALNSFTVDEDTTDGVLYYAMSVDNKESFVVGKSTESLRTIARNNAGTWEYNSNATFASATFTTATANDMFTAIQDAMSVAANQMPSSEISELTAATLGTEVDLAIILYSTSYPGPYSDGVSINYDANTFYESVSESEYSWEHVESDKVRVTSLIAANLKVRVI